MKIAIEAQRLFRPHKHGLDIVAYEMLRRLPVDGKKHEYHLLVKDDKDKCITPKDRRFIPAMGYLPYPIWEQALVPRYCNKTKVDLLHCTANTAPLRVKQPLLLTLHDVIFLNDFPPRFNTNWYQYLGNKYRSMIVPAIAKKAVHIITVSEYQKIQIANKLSISPDKISVISNGADNRFFTDYREDVIATVLAKYNIEPGYIFFMANTDARKNTTGVLHAYSRLKKQLSKAPRLVIKGLQKEELKHLLSNEKLEKLATSIDLISYIDYDHLPMIYQGSSMLWFPSFSEGFGMPIIEAMAGGVPVVTSNISCMPETAGNAAYLIDPYQPQQMADAAATILSDPETARLLSEKGRIRASHFTWNNAVNQLVEVYNKTEQII